MIATGYGLAVAVGIFVAIACGSADAHINPAVTLAFAISSGDFTRLLPYSVAQLLGGVVGATLVWLHFYPHWQATHESGLKLACFSTGPAIRNAGANFASETIGTFLLVLGIASIFSGAVGPAGPAVGLGPFLVGALVCAIGLGLGGTTGFAINPARDLGPADRSRDSADRREGPFGLGIRACAGVWRFPRWRPGRSVHQVRTDLVSADRAGAQLQRWSWGGVNFGTDR